MKEDGSYEIFAIHMGTAYLGKYGLQEEYYTGALITTEVYQWIQKAIKSFETGVPLT